jgi:hypothetical protein
MLMCLSNGQFPLSLIEMLTKLSCVVYHSSQLHIDGDPNLNWSPILLYLYMHVLFISYFFMNVYFSRRRKDR